MHPPTLSIAAPLEGTPDEFNDPDEAAPDEDPIARFMGDLDRCSKLSSNGSPCGQAVVGPGATVCRMHGGAAPQVREAAITRLRDARDTALDRLVSSLKLRGEDMDPRTLLDIVTRLTDKVELLEGRATARTETAEFKLDEVRATFNVKLDELASSYARAPMVLDMIDKMMSEGEYAEAEVVEEAADG